jgi:Cu/Ag efflux protein CusF
MRKVTLMILAVAMAGLLFAQATPLLAEGKKAGANTHELKATVVSVDMDTKMLTIKDENGEEKTAPVLESAVAQLKGLKVGDTITVTCQDDENGGHQGVSKITHGKAK